MKLFNTKVTSQEELDYDNKRLIYVNDLVPVTTHSYEDHNLSTDQVISLFDGGYRFGVLEQLDSLRNQSMVTEKKVMALVEELKKLMHEQNIDRHDGEKYTTELKSIFHDYRSKVESQLTKKFDVCQYSNEERIRGKEVKDRGNVFLERVLRTFENFSNSKDLF